MELSKTQLRFLKKEANQLKALYQLGKNDIGATHLDLFDKALLARELIKVSVMKSVLTPIKEVALAVSLQTGAVLIETKGRTFVLYRRNAKDPKIKLPL